MAEPIFHIADLRHLRCSHVRQGRRTVDVVLQFADPTGKLLPKKLDVAGLQLSERELQDDYYGGCDEIRVFDQNISGAQLEFGRFVIQFWLRGEIICERVADSVTVRSVES